MLGGRLFTETALLDGPLKSKLVGVRVALQEGILSA